MFLVIWADVSLIFSHSRVRISPIPGYEVNQNKGCFNLSKYEETLKVIAVIRAHGHHKATPGFPKWL